MIVEERIYTIAPGKLGAYLEIYTKGPLDLQKRIQGNLIGYFTTEVGQLSSLVHFWGYDSFEDRLERRARLAAEPEWQEYLKACTPMIIEMQNRIMLPTLFSPIF